MVLILGVVGQLLLRSGATVLSIVGVACLLSGR